MVTRQRVKDVWVEFNNGQVRIDKSWRQGDTLSSLRRSKADGRDSYAVMRQLEPGDRVIHVKKQKKDWQIIGLSSVKHRAMERNDLYKIKLDNYVRKTLPLKGFLSKYGELVNQELDTEGHIERYPFIRRKGFPGRLYPSQAYLLRATPKLAGWFMEALGEPGSPDASERSNGNLTPAPAKDFRQYLVQFEAKVSPRHHKLQTRFEEYLGTLRLTYKANLNYVDLRYQDADDCLVLAEIKPCDEANVRYAIRTALGQLLDYAQKERHDRLLIVVEVAPRVRDRELALSNGLGIAHPRGRSFKVLWPISKGSARPNLP